MVATRNPLLVREYEQLLERFGVERPVQKSMDEALRSRSPLRSMGKAIAAADRQAGYDLDESNVTGFDYHIELLRHAFGADEWEELMHRVFFGEFPTHDLNAVAVETPHGHLCLVNQGTQTLLSGWAWVFAVLGRELTRAEDPHEFLRSARGRDSLRGLTYLLCTSNDLGGAEQLTHEIASGYKRHGLAMLRVANQINEAMMMFVVAHELGHIAVGLPGSGNKRHIATPVGDLGVVDTSHSEEYAADAYANELLCRLGRGRAGGVPLAASFGGPCLMALLEMVPVFGAKVAGRTPGSDVHDRSHPSPLDRFEHLVQRVHGLEEPVRGPRPNVFLKLQYHDLVGYLRHLMQAVGTARVTVDGGRLEVELH